MGIRKAVGALSRKGADLVRTFSRPGSGSTKLSVDERQTLAYKNKLKESDPNFDVELKKIERKKKQLYISVLLGILMILVTVVCSFTNQLRGADSPRCLSIYMYPAYAKINGFDTRYTKLAKKYHLYLYREQGKDRAPTENNLITLDGIPALFIPGNAGSYKQARSIAAATANLYFDKRVDIDNPQTQNLDFFTADFNEDFTAFHGRTMLDQAEYLNDAVRYILSLYAERKHDADYVPPKSVLIIGHSMGGVVARVMPTLKNHVPESVNTILTLSAPHAVAPATFDGDILNIYKETNNFWRSSFNDKTSFFSQNVTVVSITGGILDTVLPADYTTIEDLIPYTNGFTVYTTTIPQVWTPIDHLAIVWCDQLRNVIAKLLLEMVDYSVSSRTHSVDQRMRLARKLLLSKLENYSSQDLKVVLSEDESFQAVQLSESFGEVDINSALEITEKTMSNLPKFNLHHIPDNPGVINFALLSSFKDFGLYFCRNNIINPNIKFNPHENELNCIAANDDLAVVPRSTKNTEYPSDSALGGSESPFWMLNVNDTVISQYNYILITKPGSRLRDDDFLVSQLTTTAATKVADYNPFKVLFRRPTLRYQREISPSLVTTVELPHLSHSLVSYSLKANFRPDDILFQPFIRQSIDKPFETKWHVNILEAPQDLNFHSVAPFIPTYLEYNSSLQLMIVKPPGLDISVSLTIDWPLTFKMLFIRYRLAIAAFTTGLVFLVLSYQFWNYNNSGVFPSFDDSMIVLLNRYWVKLYLLSALLTPLTNIHILEQLLSMFDSIGVIDSGIQSAKVIFSNAYFLGIRETFMWWLGPVFLSMTIAAVFILFKIIVMVQQLCSKLARGLNKPVPALDTLDIVSEGYLNEGTRNSRRSRHFIGASLLFLSVLFYMPYQFAFVIVSFIQVIICIRISALSGKGKDFCNLRNYNSSLLMLVLLIVPINAPIILVFLHNVAIRWETPFRSHHNCLAVLPIILLIERNTMLRMPARFPNKSFAGSITVGSLVVFAVYSFIYGTRNLYWLHHLFNFFCLWLLFCNLA